jgi:hypothetical protein
MQKASLKNLGNGAVIERFDRELSEVLENVLDLNTDAKIKRHILLKVVITPDEDRDFGIIEVQTSTKLAPMSSLGLKMHIGKGKDGAVEGYEAVTPTSKQMDLDFSEESNVSTLRKVK